MEGFFTDPYGGNSIVAAVAWLQGTLLGTIATVTATISVASIGFMMLSGRFPVRRGATAILGCFILFGALPIAAGIQGGVSSLQGRADIPPAPLPPLIVPSGEALPAAGGWTPPPRHSGLQGEYREQGAPPPSAPRPGSEPAAAAPAPTQ